MKLRIFRSPAFYLFLLILMTAAFCTHPLKVNDPNLIILIIDTLRADRLGCYGYQEIKTPHIDRLAEEGMIFTNAVCQVPLTLPSHCSIFTGRYPTAHEARHNGLFNLGEDEVTLAEVLRENNFETAAFVGSYVLNSGFGLEQGFQTFSDIQISLDDVRRMKQIQKIKEPERVAEEVNEDFFRWLSTVKSKQFFAWVHYYDPHWPYHPPEWTEKEIEGEEGYDREVSYSDQCIGDILKKLEEMDLLDRSVIVFLSDHGEALGEHGELTHGIFIYDCCMKIPMIIRAPWMIKGGSEYQGLFETVDIMPTLLELFGLASPSKVQGESFARNILKGRLLEGKGESYGESYMPTFEYGWSELKSIRKAGMKYIEAPLPELYHLASDPEELTNLHNPGSKESAELREALHKLIEKITPEGSDPYQMEEIDEEKIKMLKSLGYLSGDYFRAGKIEPGQERVDPKLTIEEENIFWNGKRLMNEGKFKEAIATFQHVLSKNPKNNQARIFMIKVLLSMGRYQTAEEEISKAIEIADLDQTAMMSLGAELWNIHGYLLERKNDLEGAEQAYQKALEIKPNNEIAFTSLTIFYISHKKLDKAIEVVQGALQFNPENILAMTYLFKLHVQEKDIDQAAEVAKKLVHFDLSDDVEMLILAGNVLKVKRMMPEAAMAFEQVLRTKPKDIDMLRNLGSIYLIVEDHPKARKIYEEILEIDPEEYTAHFYLGVIALKKNDEEEARKRFDRVLQLNPTYYPVFNALGSWLRNKGRSEEAKEEFRKALSLNPEDQIAIQGLKSIR